MAAKSEQSPHFIVSERVVIGDEIKPAAIKVDNGSICEITTPAEAHKSGIPVVDYGNLVVMAGIVDSHVHINEPGRTDWEGFWTATRAACAGGVTTIVDMPLNSIPVTTTLDALKTKIKEMENKLWVDVALLGGIIPGNAEELIPMVKHGVVGFKCFMVHSGIDEFPAATNKDISLALQKLGQLDDPVVFMFHAEHPDKLSEAEEKVKHRDHTIYQTFLDSRPKSAEDEAIANVIKLLKASGNKVPCHIVHLASSSALGMLENAQLEGLKLSAETTYHYLYLSSEKVPMRNTLFKCCPPIREDSNREQLWKAVGRGLITQLISDHSPCTTNLKKLELGDFMQAWGGIASLQLGLPLMWTEASKRGYTIQNLSKWMSNNTSKLVKLNNKKGSIEVGKDADFVVWNPEETFVVNTSNLEMKNKRTPYEGEKLSGVVKTTILRGKIIYQNGKFNVDKPVGGWIKGTANDSKL